MYGAGQTPKEGLRQALRNTQALIQEPGARFGVNFFVPTGFHIRKEQWTRAQSAAVEEAARRQRAASSDFSLPELGAVPSPPPLKSLEANFAEQLDTLIEEGIQVASFHFGWPSRHDVDRLHDAGLFLIGNATSVVEAQTLEDKGADAVIAQGLEAGGHRGAFINDSMVGTLPLTHSIVEAVNVPVIAAGGIMHGADIVAALAAGASAAQLGTAFLTTAECGAASIHEKMLLQSDDSMCPTVVTQAFTGKPARGLMNSWAQKMQDIEAQLPNCFNGIPAGRMLQGAASKAERSDITYMWAGQEYSRCRPGMRAAELMAELVHEASTVSVGP
jgi:nitronate monooxygenase